jgi:hypothetical protein
MLEPLREREQAQQRREVTLRQAGPVVIATRASWLQRLGDWFAEAGDAAMQRHAKAWTLPR